MTEKCWASSCDADAYWHVATRFWGHYVENAAMCRLHANRRPWTRHPLDRSVCTHPDSAWTDDGCVMPEAEGSDDLHAELSRPREPVAA